LFLGRCLHTDTEDQPLLQRESPLNSLFRGILEINSAKNFVLRWSVWDAHGVLAPSPGTRPPPPHLPQVASALV
jgi:hypothetical protein